MPIKGSCLLFDTELKEALHDAVELAAYGLSSKGRSASIGSVYALIRKTGIEVDLPTIGEIYNDVMPRDDANFSTETEIDNYVGKTWRQDIQKIVEMEDLFGEQQIGEEKPERAVVETIMRALYNDVVNDGRTTSDMLALQKALANGIKRKLGKLDGKKATKQDMVTLINQALGWEKMGILDLNGHLNSIEDLFNNMKRELENASEEIRQSEDENVVDRWNEYIKNLETATYQLLFRQNDARQVRDEALIKKGFGMKRGNKEEVLDWNKLAAFGSISTMRRNAYDAFIDAGFTPNQATRVADTLEQEFYDLKAETVLKQTQSPEKFGKGAKKIVLRNAGLNHLLAGKTMAEWVKDQKVETVEELAQQAYDELDKTNYIPQVKKEAVRLLEQFFNENYARVNEVEVQRVINDILGKGTPNEKTVIEWIKENGIQNQDDLYKAIDAALAGRNISPQNDVAIRGEFNRILDINNRAEKELRTKQEAAEAYEAKKYKPTKSDLKRLVELYHLGAFESAYNKSLFRVLGVDDLVAADLDDIRALAETASKLSRAVGNAKGYNLYNDASVATLFQTIQRDIDRIIQRNINNKSKLLKILSFISNFLNVMLSSMLGMPTTMVQNIFSGFKAVLTGLRTGNFGNTKDSFRLFIAMLADVTKTGQAYGEEIGSFATQELYLNTLRFKWGKDATISDKARSVLLGITMPLRIGLLAFDSANKVALSNKVFYNQMRNALMKIGNKSSSEANEFLNQALYGKSLEDAKVMARKIAEETNATLPLHLRHKITDSYVTRLANDVVKANIITQGGLQNNENEKGVLDALIKGAYHVAGISLGHEPNNPISRGIKTFRDSRKRNEEKYIKAKDWSGLTAHKAGTAVLNNFLIRFAGGATNWLVLRAKEGLPGVGLITGFGGKWNKDIKYLGTDEQGNKNLKEEVISRESARSDIARNMIGVTYAMLFQLLGYSLFGGDDDDETRKKMKQLKDLQKKKGLTEAQHKEMELLKDKANAYTALKSNRDKQRWFRNLAPDLQLIKYYIETAKQSGDASIAEGIVQYVTRTYAGNDRFSVTGKLKDAGILLAQGDVDAGLGTLASIFGDRVSIPMYRQYKEYVRVATNPWRSDPVPPEKYVPPTNLFEGFFGGGLIQDLVGEDPSITAMPGIGPAAYERFKKKGIKKISDIENINDLNMEDGKGSILDAKERAQAKKWLEEYKKSN